MTLGPTQPDPPKTENFVTQTDPTQADSWMEPTNSGLCICVPSLFGTLSPPFSSLPFLYVSIIPLLVSAPVAHNFCHQVYYKK